MQEVTYDNKIEIDLEEYLGEEKMIQAFRKRRQQQWQMKERYRRAAPYLMPGGALVSLVLFHSPLVCGLWLLTTFVLWLAAFDGLGLELHSGTYRPNMSDIARRAEKCGILAAVYVEPEELPIYLKIADEDPELACAGLRMEIERRMRTLATMHRISEGRLCIIIAELRKKGVFNEQQHIVLSNLRQRLNSAVHGDQLEKGTNQWLRFLGPRLIARLDELLQESAARISSSTITLTPPV
jgi:hypothetical protein